MTADKINVAMARHIHDMAEHCDKGIRQRYMGQSPLELIAPEHAEPRGMTVHYLSQAERILKDLLAEIADKRRACEAQQTTLVAAE